MDDEVDVLGEAADQPEGLGEGGSALEQQVRVTLGQRVEEEVEDEADPEILLDIVRRRAEAAGRGGDHVAPVPLRGARERRRRLLTSCRRLRPAGDVARDGQRPAGQVPRVPGEVVLDRIGEMALEDGNDPGVAGGVGAEPA